MRIGYLGWRMAYSIFAFLISMTITFSLLHLMPGDYLHAILPYLAEKNPQATVLFQEQFGLNKPLIEQYTLYMGNVLGGNWGYSIHYGLPVVAVISEKLYWTMLIFIPATLLSILIGMAIGSYSGWTCGSNLDSITFKIMIFLGAVPSYWWALFLILVLGYYLNLFPLGGYVGIETLERGVDPLDVAHHAILPIISLTIVSIPGIYYLMRNSMISTFGEDYILNARSKGFSETYILRHHALRNALLPMLTVLAMEMAHMIMGSVFIETIFSWPGMGLLTYEALRVRDIPLLQGIFLMDTLIIIIANAAADFSYPLVDPRVKVV